MNLKSAPILTLIAFLFYFSGFSQNDEYLNDQLIVKFKGNQNLSVNPENTTFNVRDLDILNNKHQIESINALQKSTENKSFLLKFHEDKNIEELIEEYQNSGLFEYVEPNYIVHTTGILTQDLVQPNDPFYSHQWALKNRGNFTVGGIRAVEGADINIEPAWAIEKGSPSIVVAVLDTGIDISHPEFDGRLWENPNFTEDDGFLYDRHGWNFVDDNNEISDDEGHGTAVSGIIAANTNNSIGFAGVDWYCKIMTVKVMGNDGKGSTAGIIEGIYYAVDRGANVINMSLGSSGYSHSFEQAIDYAVQNNVTVVAAMGNDNSSIISYPAGYLNAIAVGSTDPNDHRSSNWYNDPNSGSNYGNHIDVVAPGGHIRVLSHNSNSYNAQSVGTSLSTPFVAGLASLLLAQDPTKTPDEIRQIIRSTADDQVGANYEDTQGFDIYHGFGRINAYEALVAGTLSIADYEKEDIILYPNPAKEYFTIQNNNFSKLQVFSIDGRIVLSKKINGLSEITQDVSNWNPGVYIIKLNNTKGQTSTGKLIIK